MGSKNNIDLEFHTKPMDVSSNQDNTNSSKNDNTLTKISRNSFRLPVRKLDDVHLQIEGEKFELINISGYDQIGVGISLKNPNAFRTGQKFKNIQIQLQKTSFVLQGVVRHISPNGNGGYLCGIKFKNLTGKDLADIQEFIRKCHSDLFR